MSIDGADQVAEWMRRYGERVTAEMARVVIRAAFRVDLDVKNAIESGPTTGVVYNRGPGQNRSAVHQSSAPGEAPALDTGRLWASLYFRQVNRLQAEIGANAKYGSALEFGTARVQPRPAWLPAVLREQPRFRQEILAAMRGSAAQ
jgi:hypothetical protein